MFNYIQTFFVDPAAVQGAATIVITGVDLFFKAKPNNLYNSSGILNPGVSVSLCEVENDVPVLAKEFQAKARKEYGEIFAIDDASVSTGFAFSSPISVETNRFYGIIIRFDDSNYQLWVNKFGDKILGSNDPSPGSSSARDGVLFLEGSGSNMTPSTDIDLKYKVRIAKFTTDTITADLVNKDYEFLSIQDRVGAFVGGEDVFIAATQYAGTLSVGASNTVVTGGGTTLTDLVAGQSIIVKSNDTYSVSTVVSIANTTHMSISPALGITNSAAVFFKGPTAKIASIDYVTGKVVAKDSTANSTVKFVGGSTIRGRTSNTTAVITSVDNLKIDEFVSHVNVVSQSVSGISTSYNLAQANGANFAVSNTFSALTEGQQTPVGSVGRYILSRSNEVDQAYMYTGNKSAVIKLNLSSNNPYSSPVLRDTEADFTVKQMLVSNTHIVSGIDTEVGANGIAAAKHFTSKMTFEASRQAEDLRVYASVYRPVGTDVKFYAKIHNTSDSEPFDDKSWSPLEIKDGRDQIRSSLANTKDFVEYEIGFAAAPETLETLAGGFTVVDNTNTITGVGTADLTTKVAAGTLLKLYSPLFPTNYVVVRVTSRSSTVITLSEIVTNDNVVGSGMKVDVLKYPMVAFNNGLNTNIVRYFDSAGAYHDKFNTVQIKVVLLADSTNIVPTVDQLEVIGVSA